MAEINESTEIQIELIEHREHTTLRAVQFRVKRKAREVQRGGVPEPADVTLVMRSAKLGVRESDLDSLLAKYGALKVTEALDAMEAYVADPDADRILNRAAYLKAVLANRYPDGTLPEPLSASELKSSKAQDRAPDDKEVLEAWRAERLRQIRAEFSALPEPEQAQWLDRARSHKNLKVMTAAMNKRLEAGEWESPLIRHAVLDTYAVSRYRADWKEPSEMDLVMFSVEQARA